MAEDGEADLSRSDMAETTNQPAPGPSFASINKQPSTGPPLSRIFSRSSPPGTPQVAESSSKRPRPESQPMTTTSSSSSIQPDQQANNMADINGASPYGTRSRNKTGSSRPNYAEDHELDVEYEWASGKKPQAASSSFIPAYPYHGDGEKSSGINTRRSSNATTNGPTATSKAASLCAPKDHLPGMSSFSLNPEISTAPPVPTRKRKAPGSVPSASHTSSAVIQPPASSVARRTAAPITSNPMSSTNLMTFEDCQGYLKSGKLKADDGVVLSANDQVYLICEPPGEPYYLARIMEFLHVENDHNKPVDSLRVNWYFRPRDIQRKVNDTRLVFASMQSDTCPITSLRGKCRISHKSDIENLDEYRKTKDCFWYEKMFDRYIHRYYDVIPTCQVINVPSRVKKVLDERWQFIVVEIGRAKDFISATKSCKRCAGYCASNLSVDCAVCKNTYHMNCVRPPLLKKPARGFGWSCGPCSRKQERKLEARNTPIVGEKAVDGEEEEIVDEEEDDHGAGSQAAIGDGTQGQDTQNSGPKPPTAEQIAQAKLWPYRYLGIHCEVEDALDYDDRIYPRASSRLGPKHQANVPDWYGRPVELVKPESKKKNVKGSSHKKDGKLSKDMAAAAEAEKLSKENRPKWVVEEPLGYIPRGEDFPNSDPRNTALLNFRLPKVDEVSSRGQDDHSSAMGADQREKVVEDYMDRTKEVAKEIKVPEYNTNFMDKALELLITDGYNPEKALAQLRLVQRRKDLKNPELTKEELKRFEEGVVRFGSELRNISRHVGKSQKHGEIVRFYYEWKKTVRGKQIWDNYEGRKGKKQAKQIDAKFLDDVADDVDDSAFDNGKAAARKRGFECKFCASRRSPQWRRSPATAPGTTVPADSASKNSKDKSAHIMLALCQRCAGLWRRYGIQWENIDEVAKKVAQTGGRQWKRKIDEELLIELVSANQVSSVGISSTAASVAASVGMEVPASLMIQPGQEVPKKRQKTATDPPIVAGSQMVPTIEPPKKKVVEKPPEPPLIPEQPKLRVLSCAVCYMFQPMDDDQLLTCRYCKLTVHRNCYGIPDGRASDKWTCDMCVNDSSHQVSTTYECILCSVRADTDPFELMEPPKVSHKKKTDREREKERLEREMVIEATELYFHQQEEKGRPKEPRQPLKRTSGNNWVHVVCAIFHPEIKFSDPKKLEVVEGFAAIPVAKYSQTCKLCKKADGACINCSHCQASVHVACAQQFGYSLGFDLNPIKQSRSHAVNTVSMGSEVGNATAVVFCKEHPPKHPIHKIHELINSTTLNALQMFARSHKQADPSLTGTVRKALMVQAAARTIAPVGVSGSNLRRSNSTTANGASTNSIAAPTTRSSRVSPSVLTVQSEEVDEDGDRVVHLSDANVVESDSKKCISCSADASPKWHNIRPKISKPPPAAESLVVQSSAETFKVNSQPQGDLQNGHVNGHGPNLYDSSTVPLSSQTSEMPHSNGVTNGDDSDHSQVTSQDSDIRTVAQGTEPEPEMVNRVEEDPGFLCHKCHLRKLKNPTPLRASTPRPDSIQPKVEPVQDQEPLSPQVSLVWRQGPAVPPQDPYRGWSNAPGVPYNAPRDRSPNGVPHSPPVVAPPPPPPHPHQHYGPSPQEYYGPPRNHTNGSQHRVRPPLQYNMPPQPIGAEPVSFQFRRDPETGQMMQVPYIPPALRGQNTPNQQPLRTPPPPHPRRTSSPPRPHHLRSPPPQHSLRSSPPTHGIRSPPSTLPMGSPSIQEQGPNGPPEAAENPFAVPYGTSPRQQYQRHLYASPTGNHARPETPPDGYGRGGRWSTDPGPMMNGASASPSLRNLLH